MNATRLVLTAGLLTTLVGPAHAETKVLTREPGPGQLRNGETVLVDDGACPPGQIKQVAGGSNRAIGTDTQRPGTPRQVTCVRR